MYATREDLVIHYGSIAISELESSKTSKDNPPEAVTIKALESATGIIDGYLVKDYILPVPDNHQMELICCQIAIYLMYTRHAPDDVRNRYKDAIGWLKDIQKGIVELTFATKLSDIEKESVQHQEPVVVGDYSSGSAFSDEIFNKMPGMNPR
jgi:phage gp36-like protein